MNGTRFKKAAAVLLTATLLLVAKAGAWELSEPVVAREDSVYVFEHSFESGLAPDSLLKLLYEPNNLVEINRDLPGDVEVGQVEGDSYKVFAQYEFLWFYENRMVLHRSLDRETGSVSIELVDFHQTFGVAPEPRFSHAGYVVLPRPGGGSEVHFYQVTAFDDQLGRLACRTFQKQPLSSCLRLNPTYTSTSPSRPFSLQVIDLYKSTPIETQAVQDNVRLRLSSRRSISLRFILGHFWNHLVLLRLSVREPRVTVLDDCI